MRLVVILIVADNPGSVAVLPWVAFLQKTNLVLPILLPGQEPGVNLFQRLIS